MELFRIHAYEVIPQRLSQARTKPQGGAFDAPAGFKRSLERYIDEADLQQQPPVSFHPNFADEAEQATNSIRDRVINYAFGSTASAKSAAMFLATRLSESMDDRSKSSLLVLAAYRMDQKRRFICWAFPKDKDEPYGFSAQGEHAKIHIVENAFSRVSSYRKAALFSGQKQADHFWNGHVIDNQSSVADYWVRTFLDCKYLIDSRTGTQMLARILRKTHDQLESRDDKDQISSSILTVRGTRRRNYSLNRFANDFLAGTAKSVFLQNSPPEAVSTEFELDREELEAKVSLRVFRLEDDVVVMAPFDSINNGGSVRVTGRHRRRLKCEGIVVDEKVRPRRAR